MRLNPELDGIDHINIYSQGKTELGQFLTNFSEAGFTSMEHGKFASVEAYWYWLGCSHPDKDKLRPLWGFNAKKIGRELKALDWQDSPEFKQNIKKAIYAKVFNVPRMATELKRSTLPFKHYYNYKGKVVEPQDGKWILEFLEELRKRMNNCPGLIYYKGDLFEAPEGVCLVHSCNSMGYWGAGVAEEFKKRFPESYQQQLKLCHSHTDKTHLLGRALANHEGGYLVGSLFTSAGVGNSKSPDRTIPAMTGQALVELVVNYKVKEIWMPKINSGLFGIEWERTEAVLLGILIKRPDLKIVVCEP